MSEHIPLTERDVEVVTWMAAGYVVKQIGPMVGVSKDAVRKQVNRTAERLGIKGSLQPALVDYAYRHGYIKAAKPTKLRPLPARHRQILRLVAKGLGYREIAAKLDISPFSVRSHQRRIHKALGAETNAQAVAVAWEAGLLRGSGVAASNSTKGSTT
ncbi:LuxR C-terminal-related transcriptional regulator [Streptomyces sp. NPDC059759]|uniref:LuxR C-terminal-related transcriptional regulator n=1 Tax=unclassified Streptomyces TaxID=2593676 RepID=UPI003657FEA0